ncbi:hypothetical protein Tco_0123060 [Tanacetum coccineum]
MTSAGGSTGGSTRGSQSESISSLVSQDYRRKLCCEKGTVMNIDMPLKYSACWRELGIRGGLGLIARVEDVEGTTTDDEMVMHVLGIDPHAFTHFRDARKSRWRQIFAFADLKKFNNDSIQAICSMHESPNASVHCRAKKECTSFHRQKDMSLFVSVSVAVNITGDTIFRYALWMFGATRLNTFDETGKLLYLCSSASFSVVQLAKSGEFRIGFAIQKGVAAQLAEQRAREESERLRLQECGQIGEKRKRDLGLEFWSCLLENCKCRDVLWA